LPGFMGKSVQEPRVCENKNHALRC